MLNMIERMKRGGGGSLDIGVLGLPRLGGVSSKSLITTSFLGRPLLLLTIVSS